MLLPLGRSLEVEMEGLMVKLAYINKVKGRKEQ